MESRKIVLTLLLKGQQRRHVRHFGHRGGRRRRMIRENSIETYTLPYVKQTASGSLMCDPGNPEPVLCNNLEGRVGREVD